MSPVLSDKHFHDEAAAYRFVEARVWPDGQICPHCGGVERIGRMGGKSTRIGTYKCYRCRKPFTVKIGTIFESSHVALHLWLQAIFLMASSKKGISSNQLHRTLGVTLKTAWFMSHRIREAMRDGSLSPLGGAGKVVEADETYIGRLRGMRKTRGPGHKMKVLSLVERGGQMRSIMVESVSRPTIEKIVKANVDRESWLMTDEAPYYPRIGRNFAGHKSVNHSHDEWVRGSAHTNTIEGAFSIFKRGMRGVYQHCGEKHLHRYLAEFDFPVQLPRGAGRERRRAGGVGVEGYHREAPHLSNDSLRDNGDMAENPERKPKPTKKMTKAEQSERFKETARELGVDESGEAFERALHKLAPPRHHKSGS